MISIISKRRTTLSYRILSVFIAIAFIFSLILPPTPLSAQMVPQTLLDLPLPGAMISLTPSFNPPIIKGITINPENSLMFDFIIEEGDRDLEGRQLRDESQKLIKYFLAALTVPEDQLWVNLSPYEKERVISAGLGDTEMGRDLLAQDYLLKQLAASLMYPEDALGKQFWGRVYQKAQELYGTTEIPLNTFNKIWIVPEKAVVLEHGNSAFVIESHLKVMLQEDYFALKNNLQNKKLGLNHVEEKDANIISGVTADVVREVLIPAIEKEVNEGATFANLRQIYHSMILATWYKKNLTQTLLGQVYVDQNKTKGIDTDDKQINRKIYNQYLEAFQKGVYNYIRTDYDPASKQIIPRKYFSGGFAADKMKETTGFVTVNDLSRSSPAAVGEALRWSNTFAGEDRKSFNEGIESALSQLTPSEQKRILGQDAAQVSDIDKASVALFEDTNPKNLARATGSSPVGAKFGIDRQKEKLAKALSSKNLAEDYYDVVYLVVDDASYAETKELVESLRGTVIPRAASIDIVRQPEGKIKGNWSAIINILLDDERWEKIKNNQHQNIAVILSAGTGSRNYPLTATGYADKGKQAAPNGHSYIEQQFKQIMQYFETRHKGMLIVSNDGIKAISQQVRLGVDQGIQFMGSTLPVRNPELSELGMADIVRDSTTEGKAVTQFVEKVPLINRIMKFYGAKTEKEAEEVLKQIESGQKEELLIPTNWADYHLTLDALKEIHMRYINLLSNSGQPLYLQYGLDTAKDLFESATLDEEIYLQNKEKEKWNREDAIRVRNVSRQLQKDFGFGFVSTGSDAIFIDTGTNASYLSAVQRLLNDKNMRDLLGIKDPVNGRLIGENVVLGNNVIVEEGAILLGNVVINRGKIGRGAVVINSVVDELVAEENTLTYSVDALQESVYLRSGNLVTDIFFRREVNLSRTDIIQDSVRVYHVTTKASHDPKKPPRLIGPVFITNSGEVVNKRPESTITEIRGNEAVIRTKIRVNMPIKLTAKDEIQEYNLIHPQLGVVAHIVGVKNVIREYYPLGNSLGKLNLMDSVLGKSIKTNLSVTSSDDVLYNVKPITEKQTMWDANIWPRNARSNNQYPSLRQEIRTYKVSFAEMSYFPDKAATKEFLTQRLLKYVTDAKAQKDTVSSPLQQETVVTLNEDQAVRPQKVGGIDLNPAFLDLQIKRDGNGVPLPLPQQPIGQMHIEGFVPIIIRIELIPFGLPSFVSETGQPDKPNLTFHSFFAVKEDVECLV